MQQNCLTSLRNKVTLTPKQKLEIIHTKFSIDRIRKQSPGCTSAEMHSSPLCFRDIREICACGTFKMAEILCNL